MITIPGKTPTIALEHSIYRSGSHFIDEINRIFTRDKTCSMILEKDHFDGKEYTADSFFEEAKQYFDKPELFYGTFDKPQESSIQEIILKKPANYHPFSFPSPLRTQWTENNTAYYRMFTKNIADTILLFVPGWSRADLKAEEKMCTQFLANNIDTCLITKPFHQERTVANTYSGELFISGNVFLTVMNFRQLVAELRFLVQHFRKKYKYIGIMGMSSGGIQAGLAANTETIDFYFPVMTGARLGSLAWNSKLTKFVKQDIIKKGLSEEQLNKVWAIADQYYLGHTCKSKHIKQFISLYDEIVQPEYQFMLWKILNKPSLYEMQCGHISIVFYFKRIVQEITNFINERKNSC